MDATQLKRALGHLASLRVTIPVLLIALAATAAWYVSRFPRPNPTTYQAVFLTNGQAYFGRLHSLSPGYVRLDDVYYLIANPQPNDTAEAERARKSQLVKLGSEVHEPVPVMYIPKRQILFWENLKADSRLVQGIISGQ